MHSSRYLVPHLLCDLLVDPLHLLRHWVRNGGSEMFVPLLMTAALRPSRPLPCMVLSPLSWEGYHKAEGVEAARGARDGYTKRSCILVDWVGVRTELQSCGACVSEACMGRREAGISGEYEGWSAGCMRGGALL